MNDDLTDSLNRRFRWPDGAGVLLTGSHAEGTALRDANLNIMVVGAPAGWVPSDGGDPVFRPMSIARNHLFDSDPEVCIDVIRSERIPDLIEITRDMARIEDPSTPDLSLPLLDVLEVRALARLRSGRVLHGAAAVERWRGLLHVSELPAFYCTVTYLACEHFLGRAGTAHEAGFAVDESVLTRIALEDLLVSALAAEGRVLYSVKNLGRSIAASLRGASAPPRVLTEAGALLGGGATGSASPALISDLAADLLDWLPTAPYGATAARYIRAKK